MSELKLENIGYRYKNTKNDVIRNICCSFAGGQLACVTGPSGSGKTTLLSIMAGLDAPSQGSILIDGVNLASLDLDRYRREKISMIFQAFHLFSLLTSLENVAYPMEMNGVPKNVAKERAAELLQSVGIDGDKHKRYPSNLSGGEQQRVAIARALSTGAKVIMADEPTGNLDKANGELVMDILRRLAHQDGYCVIVVTHNLEIADTADVVYAMSDGILTCRN